MAGGTRERLQSDLVDLMHRGNRLEELPLALARIVGRAVPLDALCVLAMDPATLIPTDEAVHNGLPKSTVARTGSGTSSASRSRPTARSGAA